MIGREYRMKRIGDHGEPCERPVSDWKVDCAPLNEKLRPWQKSADALQSQEASLGPPGPHLRAVSAGWAICGLLIWCVVLLAEILMFWC